MTEKKKNNTVRVLLLFLLLLIICRFTLGIFVVQPIGALPEGATVIYFRAGLNIPFIASADGMLAKDGGGVSLLGRGIVLGAVAKNIEDRKIITLPYSETLYLWSTDGKTYDR